MELHERLTTARPVAPLELASRSPSSRTRSTSKVISELGPQLSTRPIDPTALRERVVADIRRHAQRGGRLSRDDSASASPTRSPTTSSATGRSSGSSRTTRSRRSWSTAPNEIWIERQGRLYETTVRFNDDSHLRRIINKMVAQVGRRVDESSPMVDARLPDGSRVNVVIPPLSLSGPLLTIRKFAKKRLTLDDMVASAVAVAGVDRLPRQGCVQAELNILISGGTGSGKTTLLNALSAAIPDSDRIVTIEDAAELQLHQRHVLRLEARPKNIEGEGEIAIRELVRNSLRMRPDRIIVGEVRGAEALDMLQAMNTGHDGSLSTVHANSPRDAPPPHRDDGADGRARPADARHPPAGASALDLIVHLERLEDGSRRVTHITEVQRMESDVITLQDIFEFKLESIGFDRTITGGLEPTGLRPDRAAEVREARHRAARRTSSCKRPGAGAWTEAGPHDEVPARRRPGLGRRHGCGRLRGVCARGCVGHAPADPVQDVDVPEPRLRALPAPLGAGEHRHRLGASRTGSRSTTSASTCRARPAPPASASCSLIDASLSMKGEPIKQAMAAARAFEENRASQEQLAVILFNGRHRTILPFSTNDGRITAALARKPRLAYGTHINDAVQAGVDLLKKADIDIGSIVLLSDGHDVGSRVTEADAIAGAKSARTRIFSVALKSPSFSPDALTRIARGTNGTFTVATSAASLSDIYSALSTALSNQYLISYRSLAGPAAEDLRVGEGARVHRRCRHLLHVARDTGQHRRQAVVVEPLHPVHARRGTRDRLRRRAHRARHLLPRPAPRPPLRAAAGGVHVADAGRAGAATQGGRRRLARRRRRKPQVVRAVPGLQALRRGRGARPAGRLAGDDRRRLDRRRRPRRSWSSPCSSARAGGC